MNFFFYFFLLGSPYKYMYIFSHILTLSDSPQEGLGQGLSGSGVTVSTLFWNSRSTQSIILIIRCGGLPSFFTVEISDALIV
jgi:hypothetical protein